MSNTVNLTPETALKTLYTSLYSSLSDENLPIPDPTTFEETYIDLIGNPALSVSRSTFLASWKASVELETCYQIKMNKIQTTNTRQTVKRLEKEKKAAHKETTNHLNLYVYAIVKNKLERPEGPVVTPESIQEGTKTLRDYITLLICDNKKADINSCCIPFT